MTTERMEAESDGVIANTIMVPELRVPTAASLLGLDAGAGDPYSSPSGAGGI